MLLQVVVQEIEHKFSSAVPIHAIVLFQQGFLLAGCISVTMPHGWSRREVLNGLGGCSVVGLAGCSENSPDSDDYDPELAEIVVEVDVTMETSVADAYATGAMVRAEEWQAVISAGDGAAAALNVLTKEKGEHFYDFDTPADAD